MCVFCVCLHLLDCAHIYLCASDLMCEHECMRECHFFGIHPDMFTCVLMRVSVLCVKGGT